jgi:hypothetical protein
MYMYEIQQETHARNVQIEENKAKYACVCIERIQRIWIPLPNAKRNKVGTNWCQSTR